MAKKKASAKTVEEIQVVDPILVEEAQEQPVQQEAEEVKAPVLSRKEELEVELKQIQDLLNAKYDIKNRTTLLRRQQQLQIEKKGL